MREYKFRGKRVDNGEWVCGWYVVTSVGLHIIVPFGECLFKFVQVCPDSVGQYTGLKDKNKKDAYELDIVRTPSGVRLIKWNQLHCAWGLFKNDQMMEELMASWITDEGKTPKQWCNTEMEIIGNIHETPELLEKK